MRSSTFPPAEAESQRRAALTAARQTPQSCGNVPGSNCKDDPKVNPGDRYTRDSYRRAIDRGIEQAFPLPVHLQPGQRMDSKPESKRQWLARLTEEQKAEIKAWCRRYHWHPHQLRHNYATYVRKEFGLGPAQILLGHSKADIMQL